jgi:heme A synthase
MIPAAITGVLLLVQGGLGGLTVVHELPPEIVTVHLGTALTLFALLVLINIAAYSHETGGLPRLAAPANVGSLALAGAGLTAAVMLLGAYIAGAGYSLACSGWPMCNGEVIPNTSSESVRLIFLHRVLALVLGLSLIALVAATVRGDASGPVTRLSWAALAVYGAQVMVGAANIWTEVSDVAQVAHLGVGTILWGVLAFLSLRLFAAYEAFGRGESRGASARLAGIAR